MSIEYQQIHPVSGLWPEWPGRLMLTYLSSEDARITKLFWTRAPKSRGSGDPSSLERWLKHPPSNA